jgi:hypothetical protein
MDSVLEASLARLEDWLVERGFKGNDPHDALRSPLLRALTFRNRWIGVAWVQLLRRSPIDLRKRLFVEPGHNPKGMGLFLAAYVRRYRSTGEAKDRERVDFFADWLRRNRCTGFSEACWGYNFDWPNRAFFAPEGTPTIVNTAFIAQAFLDRYELFGDAEDLRLARSACDFILNRLARIADPPGSCFSYTPLDGRRVHNANMLGAALLARTAWLSRDARLMAPAREAVVYTMARQRPDGSWPYGEGRSEHWIDNLHTGFVLNSLKEYMQFTGDNRFEEKLWRGYDYWKREFFTANGEPKFYASQLYPIDAHVVAQALLTLLAFRDLDPEATYRAFALAQWGIAKLQDESGYFHYQIGRRWRNRIPYIRWAQAWMFRALAECRMVQARNVNESHDAERVEIADGYAH